MKKLRVTVGTKTNVKTNCIFLPDTYEKIEDEVQYACAEIDTCCITEVELENGQQILSEKGCEETDIFELNYLARQIQALDLVEYEAFKGAASIINEQGETTFRDLMNLCLNIKHTDNIECLPAENQKELGEFYIDNKLLKAFETLDEQQYEWIADRLDAKKVGEEILEKENGIFTKCAYVAISNEIEDLYDGSIRMPEQADYVFKLQISPKINLSKDDEKTLYELKLPITINDYNILLEKMGVETIQDCEIYESHCILTKLDDMFYYMEKFEELNDLAANVQHLKQQGDLLTYKVLLEKISDITEETALDLCNYVQEFKVDPHIQNFVGYAAERLKGIDFPLKNELIENVDLRLYGSALMEEDGVEMTPYGALIPNDGITLAQRLISTEQQQTVTFEQKI